MRVLVFGQPKSGTTALMRSVSEAIGDATEVLEPDNLNEVDLRPDPLVVKKLFGPHDRDESAAYPAFDARLFIVRDPRDRFISSLLYDAHGRRDSVSEADLAPFLELLQAKEANPSSVSVVALHHAYWKVTGIDLLSNTLRSTQRLRTFWRNKGNEWTLVRYEDFVSGNNRDIATLVGAVELAQPQITGELARVARTRDKGDWRHWFTSQDVPVFEPFAAGFLDDFGYDDSWELSTEPTIDPATASGYVRQLIAGE